ncbi:sperm-associated antigen 1 [Rhodamnia argentea]|uniref:Sperm-associated antigen 1 n=1 Tax=Rhodamnia argentea TaxID=178133 RepID=A0A8B8P127_9MYRT|nr:sperm-associated antigen 1 [Rhodamnia argentea]
MASSGTLSLIERAHQMYRDGLYEAALGFYTEALAMAKTRPQRIALHSNRAACYLKLHDFKKAAEECTSVLELDHKHTGALMLRAQTLVTLKEYHSALFDVNRLIELDPSSEVYRNLESRLRTQLSLAPIPESEAELEEDEEVRESASDIKGDEAEICQDAGLNAAGAARGTDRENESDMTNLARSVSSEVQPVKESFEQRHDEKADRVETIPSTQVNVPIAQGTKDNSTGWQAIPKPKGHSTLDYARWDRVEDDSSEDDDEEDDEESQPQYRFRVRTVGVRPVK